MLNFPILYPLSWAFLCWNRTEIPDNVILKQQGGEGIKVLASLLHLCSGIFFPCYSSFFLLLFFGVIKAAGLQTEKKNVHRVSINNLKQLQVLFGSTCILLLLLVAENSVRGIVKITYIAFSVVSVSWWPAGNLPHMPSVLCYGREASSTFFDLSVG